MEFSLHFYESSEGTAPVRDFLEVLRATDPNDHAAVMAGLAKLRLRAYHKPPLSKAIGNELFELRHVGKLNTRVIYFFRKGRKIILVHGIRNKGQAIPRQDMNTAIDRMKDWIRRHPE